LLIEHVPEVLYFLLASTSRFDLHFSSILTIGSTSQFLMATSRTASCSTIASSSLLHIAGARTS
jgi:hypothetical protein